MSDFQSISNLMKNGGIQKKTDDVQDQLTQKMKNIRQKGKEEDTEKSS